MWMLLDLKGPSPKAQTGKPMIQITRKPNPSLHAQREKGDSDGGGNEIIVGDEGRS